MAVRREAYLMMELLFARLDCGIEEENLRANVFVLGTGLALGDSRIFQNGIFCLPCD